MPLVATFAAASARDEAAPYVGFMSWDPSALGTGWALSNGNLTATGTANNNTSIRAMPSRSSGKHYWEVTWVSRSNSNWSAMIGISDGTNNLAQYLGQGSGGWAYYSLTGHKYSNGGSTAYGASYTVGDVIGVALDIGAGKLWFAKNGVWQASGDPVAGTNPAFSGLSGSFMPALGHTGATSGNDVYTLNVGPTFAYTPPSGYNA
jgi:hypothetical protein